MPLPQEVAVLFKIMLAEDPNLRPQSMAEVAETLSRVTDEEIEAAEQSRLESATAPVKQIKGLRKRMTLLVVIVLVLGLLIGGLAWYYLSFKARDTEAILLSYANQYAGSVAFVMVDYRLIDGESVVYHNRTEGTAFLVDRNGYLLTNRHVACPWLEDSNLYVIINMLRQDERPLRLAYQVYLWFEGEKAFNRLPDLSGSTDVEDIYSIDSAFSTNGSRRLIISGVAKSPAKTWQLVKSPLKDDFAVFKIDQVPEGLEPLPLDLDLDPQKIPRLSPVITLGFPLGSRTQESNVNVSVTQGHVRRTFENMLQVDTSIHSGNSGGPIIDIRGKVIGIASGVAVGWAAGPVPIATPLSDIGMILPITKAVAFIQELKAGQIKWNGVLDLSLDIKLKQITDNAKQRRWADATAIADKELQLSLDPTLVMAAAMMHFCAGDNNGAGKLFGQALSIDNENDKAKLMLFIIDWLSAKPHISTYRQELLALDWRSPTEFLGHLVRVLEGMVDEESALKGGYTEGEESWLHYVVGLIRAKRGNLADSEDLLKKAVLAAEVDDWLFFLALAELEKVQNQRSAALQNKPQGSEYRTEIQGLAKTIEENRAAKLEQRTRLAPLLSQLKQESISPEDKQNVLEKILENDPKNGDILLGLTFYSAINEEWKLSLEYAQTFLKIKGRENAGRLSVGLLEAEILHNLGRKEELTTAGLTTRGTGP
jgi:S1-C subfamily serine protease